MVRRLPWHLDFSELGEISAVCTGVRQCGLCLEVVYIIWVC